MTVPVKVRAILFFWEETFILTVRDTSPLKPRGRNFTTISPFSPGLIGALGKEGVVQPHPPLLTVMMPTGSSPTLVNGKRTHHRLALGADGAEVNLVGLEAQLTFGRSGEWKRDSEYGEEECAEKIGFHWRISVLYYKRLNEVFGLLLKYGYGCLEYGVAPAQGLVDIHVDGIVRLDATLGGDSA